MSKYFYLFLSFLFLTSNVFAQEANIATQFSQDGNLYKNLNDTSQTLTQFKENEKCLVTHFLGNYTYKIKYKDWIGYVKDEFLFVNEDMMDLYFKHEEKQRIKAVEERENRQKRIFEIVNKDSIAKAKEDKRLALIAQRRSDSIAKVKENERLALIAQRKSDSITKVKETQRLALIAQRRNDSIAKAKEDKRLALIAQRRSDSIAKVKETERLALIAQQRNDSIAKVKETERLALITQRKSDSISKVRETQRLALIAQRRNDSIAKVREIERLALIAQRRSDSIAKVKKTERLALITQHRSDSISKVRETERLTLITQRRSDSISKIKEDERNEFRITCHYEVNEYDKFYREENIRTIPYELNEKLTVELYKRGRSVNVFFNFSEDLGCTSYLPSNRSYVKVKLENNQTISFYHSWDIDCEGFFFKGRLSSSQIINLKKSPIKSIVLKGTKQLKEISNIDYKEFFIDKLKCLE